MISGKCIKDRHIACPFSIGDYMSLRSEAPEQQRAFYHSQAWQHCRAEYISRVGGLCERCKMKGIIKPGYIVHHREWIDMDNINDPSVLLNHDNLEYLCQDCHNREHHGTQRRYIVMADGSVAVRET